MTAGAAGSLPRAARPEPRAVLGSDAPRTRSRLGPRWSLMTRFLQPWAPSSAPSLVLATRAGSCPQAAGALFREGAWHLRLFWSWAVSHAQLSPEQDSPSLTALRAVRGLGVQRRGRQARRGESRLCPRPREGSLRLGALCRGGRPRPGSTTQPPFRREGSGGWSRWAVPPAAELAWSTRQPLPASPALRLQPVSPA